MQANAKFTLAIHVCLYLQFRCEKLLPSQEIAESVDTNPVVIRRLMADLRKAGIVGSVAGKQGGFYLSKSPGQITLWDLYQAVNDRDLFHRPKPNPECPVSSNLMQLVKEPFMAAELSMKPALEKVTIADLNGKLDTILQSADAIH